MKYIKTFEDITEYKDVNSIILQNIWLMSDKIFNFTNKGLTSLKGAEKLVNCEAFYCEGNNLTSLEGIENLDKMTDIICVNNKIKNLDFLPKNIEYIECQFNNIKNLDSIRDIKTLNFILCHCNPLKDLIPNTFLYYDTEDPEIKEWYDKYYNPMIKSYDFQKEYLTNHPDRVNELVEAKVAYYDSYRTRFDNLLIHPKIKEEFSHLFNMKGIGI